MVINIVEHTHTSESPAPLRSPKLNIDQPTSNVSNPSSPQPARRLSPTTNQMQEQQQQAESNPSPLKEETQPKDDIAVGTSVRRDRRDSRLSRSRSRTVTVANIFEKFVTVTVTVTSSRSRVVTDT
jgi:hypothetical protein